MKNIAKTSLTLLAFFQIALFSTVMPVKAEEYFFQRQYAPLVSGDILYSRPGCDNAMSETEFLIHAAKSGRFDAQRILGQLNSMDSSTIPEYGSYDSPIREMYKLNIEEAMKWYRMGAEQGDIYAQFHLGQYLASDLHGSDGKNLEIKGVKNHQEALQWFRKAAEHGHAEAAYFLAVLYHEGSGITHNVPEAYFWLKNYAQKSNTKRIEAQLHLLESRLTQETKKAAETRLSTWEPLEPPHTPLKELKPLINWLGLICGTSKASGPWIRCAGADTCGSLGGVDCATEKHGTYYFVDTINGKLLEKCLYGWSKCKLPEKWTCGRPKHYKD